MIPQGLSSVELNFSETLKSQSNGGNFQFKKKYGAHAKSSASAIITIRNAYERSVLGKTNVIRRYETTKPISTSKIASKRKRFFVFLSTCVPLSQWGNKSAGI